MASKYLVLLACVSSVALAQQGARSSFSFDPIFDSTSLVAESTTKPTTTPVPILRFLDTQNPDGSYTYGYESGDGTYKIETRYPDGEVKGKYGYYDDLGEFREVEYGADVRGFIPSGQGLNSPKVVEATPAPLPEPQQPAITFKKPSVVLPTPAAATRAAPSVRKSSSGGRRRVVLRRRPIKKQQSAQPETETESRFAHFDRVSLPTQRRSGNIQQTAAPRRSFRLAAGERPVRRRLEAKPVAFLSRPQPSPVQALPEQPRFNPVQPAQPVAPVNYNAYFDAFGGHPAQNIDLNTGSFSVSYSG